MIHEVYLRRCYDLARLACKAVRGNPNVGAALVAQGRIIGEGYHQKYGKPHAEVNAIQSVHASDRHLIPHSTMYVSLEPCCHYGKTPPCVNLIMQHRIPEVHIGCLDPSDKVAGKGVKILQDNGVRVHVHHQTQAKELIAPFVNAAIRRRPHITIKYAQSADFYMGKKNQNYWISNPYTRIHAHRLRAECDAILVGTSTVLIDNPSLTTRHYPGDSPHRLVIDKDLRIPQDAAIFDTDDITVFTSVQSIDSQHHYIVPSEQDYIDSILQYCTKQGHHRLLVEGGKNTIERFISRGLWDEAYVYNAHSIKIGSDGITSPSIKGILAHKLDVADNTIMHILRPFP